MSGRVLILSRGLWRLREEVALLTGLEPVFGFGVLRKAEAIAGWGHKPTADAARRAAQRRGVPYLAIEDGFLRSLKPGPQMRPSAMVLDRSGIYYDARQTSDLETLLNEAVFTAAEISRAEAAMAAIRRLRLSKYNAAPDAPFPLPQNYSLVIDQTLGDASIAGGLASQETFDLMVGRALAEAQGQPVVVKLHPETIAGDKGGFLTRLKAHGNVTFVADAINPWQLLAGARRVYAVSSQMGFEALMAGAPVSCAGVPFYAGWGLTQDEMAVSRRRRQRSLAELFAGAYLRYSHYFDCWTRKPVTLETAIDQLSFLRQSYLGNRSPVVFYKMPRWKREPLRRLLDGPGVSFTHSSSITDALSQSRGKTAAIAAWGKTANQVRSEIEKAGATLLSVEDGFLRSAGLGAALTASLSYTFDKTGIYYDPETPSDLEHLLQNHSCDDALLARAQRMREAIVSGGFSKYNLSSRQMPQLAADGRRKMLVIGQVADDEAVRRSLAAPDHNINLTMLLALQPRRPEAFLIYKPHPDVEKLGRAGKIDEGRLQELCDAVLHDVAISDALALADEVAVFTSLAGFEALLRNKAVRCFGRPFYAGWGLTADQQSIARRTRQLSVEELVAISLIIYPRYYDPLSKLPATPEMALSRLADMRLAPRTAASRAKEIAGRSLIYLRRLKKD